MSELNHAGRNGALHANFGALTEPPLSPPALGSATPALNQPELAATPGSLEPNGTEVQATLATEPSNGRALSQDDLAKLPLQALLVRAAYVTVDQLSQALSESVTSGRPVEEIAVERGWVARNAVDALVQAKYAATAQTAEGNSPSPEPASDPEPVAAPVESVGAVESTPEPPSEPAVPIVPVQPAAIAPPEAATPPAPPPPEAAEPVIPVVSEPPALHAVPITQPPVAEAPTPESTPAEPAPALPEPVAPEPFAPEPVAPHPVAPAAVVPEQVAPAPAAPAPVAPQPEPSDSTIGVFLHLTSGERMWVGRFSTQEEAEQHAQLLVTQLIRPELGVWPRFGARLVRPEAVVSIELSPR